MGKIVINSFKNECEQALAPLQLGCGVSGGAEIASRVIQLSMEAEKKSFAISLDMINAFPSVSRKKVYDSLTGCFAPFRSCFAWMYGGNNMLYDSKGSDILEVKTGLLQGDPLSSLFFCLAFQPTLKRLLEKVESIHTSSDNRNNGRFSGRVIAFMDDVTLLVRGDEVNQTITAAEEILTPAGFKINRGKTVVIRGKDHEMGYSGPLLQTAATILGAPIGHDRGKKESLLKEKEKGITSDIELVAKGDIHRFIKFSLIRSCWNTRSGYLDRVSEPYYEYTAFCKRIDEAVDRSIYSIMDCAEPAPDTPEEKRFQTIRDLPQKLGGLGLGRHFGWAGEKARTLSRILTRAHVWYYYYNTCGIPEEMDHWKFTRLDEQIDKYRAGEGFEGSHWDSNELWCSARTRTTAVAFERGMDQMALNSQVRYVTARLHETRWEAFVQSLAAEPWWQAWLRSSAYRGSGRWLAGVNHNMQGSLQFIDDDRFRAALRLRVLIQPASVPDGLCQLLEPIPCTF